MPNLHLIIGLGATGLSCVRFLTQQNIPVAVMDTRPNPPNLTDFQHAYANVPAAFGDWDQTLLEKADTIIISPGMALTEPMIVQQIKRGKKVIGDIELFVQHANAPIIAITGTNAKSTVTTLVGEMAKTAGKKVQVGGNLGTPALDLLTTPRPELFVVELSSFQLETTYSLSAAVATVLNITLDHMDRYASVEEYRVAKHRIYSQCEIAICNRDDALTECAHPGTRKKFYFTLNTPKQNEFGLIQKNAETYLAFEDQLLLTVRELPILGRHYQANALASLALGYGYGLPIPAMVETLKTFKGLPHRCQLVRERNGVSWYNDSKGTNVGATLAAIDGLGPEITGKLILIAGGLGKNADFSPLLPALEKYVKAVILIGTAAEDLSKMIGNRIKKYFANSMEEAVAISDQVAAQGDSVLLSPACASYDMFKNFEHRGEVFTQIVKGLT